MTALLPYVLLTTFLIRDGVVRDVEGMDAEPLGPEELQALRDGVLAGLKREMGNYQAALSLLAPLIPDPRGMFQGEER